MSTLSGHTGNGNPTATSLQLEDTKEQLDSLLQDFDVLPSKLDRCIFKYIYVYLIGLFFLGDFLVTPFLFSQIGEFLLFSGIDVLLMVTIILVLWRFNVWRLRTPKTLRDLLEKKRIDVPDGDASKLYLHFLENYRDALASPKRYFLSGFLMILVGILYASRIVQILSVGQPNSFVTILAVVNQLLYLFSFLGALYCIGIVAWEMYISGWYIRKLVRVFKLRIQPFHPDLCGGLKLLGNFCFDLVSPILIGSAFMIGYLLLNLLINTGLDVIGLALFVGVPLLLILAYALPTAIFAFILPVRDIHTKMVSEGETDEDSYIARLETLREEIQSLLNTNQVEAAKAVQEKKALEETLHTPYPTWPFHVRSKIFSTVFGVSGSLLVGLITAALQQYILTLLLHTP